MSEAVATFLPANSMVPAKGVGLVRAWLLAIAGLVYAMILVGGVENLVVRTGQRGGHGVGVGQSVDE